MAVDTGLNNASAMFVANVDDKTTVAPAHLIKISAESDGTFVVTNTRNGFRKTYRARD